MEAQFKNKELFLWQIIYKTSNQHISKLCK